MSWPLIKLKDCCDVVSGATPKREVAEYWDSADIPWVTPKDISGLDNPVLKDAPEYISAAGFKSCSAAMLPKGSVLVTSRAPIGNIAIAGRDLCTNQGFKSLVPGKEVDGLYLYYCMLHCSDRLQSLGNGATFKEVSKKIVEDFEIPLPPLTEQKRIAAILDKADAIRRKRQQAIQLADEFLRAVFLNMFGDPVTNPKGMNFSTIGKLCDVATGATPSRKQEEYYGGDIPWVKTAEVDGYIIKSTEESITNEGLKNSNCKINPVGSIVLAMYGQGKTRGKVGILGINAATNQACAVIKPSPNVLMEYLYCYLKLSYESIRALGQGAGQPNLNLSIVNNFPVLLPCEAEQKAFVDISMKIEEMKNKNEASVLKADSFFNSLNQCAFSGRL